MEFIHNWLVSIITTSIFVSLAVAITPESSVKKTVKLAGGAILVLVVLLPIKNLSNTNFKLEIPKLTEQQVNEQGKQAVKNIIQQQTAAYIVNKAQASGLDITVQVVCDDGIISSPYAVNVFSSNPEIAKLKLGEIIEQDLAVPQSRQKYFAN